MKECDVTGLHSAKAMIVDLWNYNALLDDSEAKSVIKKDIIPLIQLSWDSVYHTPPRP